MRRNCFRRLINRSIRLRALPASRRRPARSAPIPARCPMPSQGVLFRQEAIAFQQHQRQWGAVAALQPLSTKVVAWFLTASAAAIALFLCVGQYCRKETAAGYLTPTAGTAKIFVPQRGTV